MDQIKKQVGKLDIPYPEKHFLEQEVRQDFDANGIVDENELIFSEEDSLELSEIHSTKIHQLLKKFGHRRQIIEQAITSIPLVTTFIFITKEKTMIDFIREGGAGMYAILILGVILLGKEVLNIIRLVVIKNHSTENLRLDTSSVLLGCLALMFVGIGWTVLGIYKSADAVIQAHLSYDVLMIGAKESLTPLILCSLISALIVLSHYTTRRMLHTWHAPIVD